MTTRTNCRKTVSLAIKTRLAAIMPPPKLTVSQWAERERILDNSGVYPGRWHNSVTPYLVGIMDEFNVPTTREVIFCKPTQVGATEAGLNILGYAAANEPAPAMLAVSNDELAKSITEARIDPMIEKCPALKDRYVPRMSRKLIKRFIGMTLYVTGARSPDNLSSKSIKNLVMDEVDKWPGASKREADSPSLVKERQKTYRLTRKTYICCTPTLRDGYIWRAKESADVERHYFVPCPHCGEEIELRFDCLRWPEREDGVTNAERAASAMYYCQECGASVTDAQKPAALRAGQWREVARRIGARQTPSTVAFWLNTLYSPFVTWQQIALEYMAGKGDLEKYQNFQNSWLGLPWEDVDTRTDADMVLQRQTALPAMIVPRWAEMLTAGVDVQRNCVYWTVRAWGPHMTSQGIAHGQSLTLEDMAAYVNGEFTREDGERMQVVLCGIDSGDQTDMVYDFSVENGDWTIAVRGAPSGAAAYQITKIEKAGSRAYGRRLLRVNGALYKDLIASRLRRENGEGSFMIHANCGEDYANQMTSEHKINVRRGGQMVQEWALRSTHAGNHYLDCEVYACCVADVLGVRTLHLQNHDAPEPEETAEGGWLGRDTGNWFNP